MVTNTNANRPTWSEMRYKFFPFSLKKGVVFVENLLWNTKLSFCILCGFLLQTFTSQPHAISLVHTSEMSTSTNARHTHAQKLLGSWMTYSARAYVWYSCLCLCLSH